MLGYLIFEDGGSITFVVIFVFYTYQNNAHALLREEKK